MRNGEWSEKEEGAGREGEESRWKGEQRIRHHNIWDGTPWSQCAGGKRTKILEPE